MNGSSSQPSWLTQQHQPLLGLPQLLVHLSPSLLITLCGNYLFKYLRFPLYLQFSNGRELVSHLFVLSAWQRGVFCKCLLSENSNAQLREEWKVPISKCVRTIKPAQVKGVGVSSKWGVQDSISKAVTISVIHRGEGFIDILSNLGSKFVMGVEAGALWTSVHSQVENPAYEGSHECSWCIKETESSSGLSRCGTERRWQS